jgi:hypothetical protein
VRAFWLHYNTVDSVIAGVQIRGKKKSHGDIGNKRARLALFIKISFDGNLLGACKNYHTPGLGIVAHSCITTT